MLQVHQNQEATVATCMPGSSYKKDIYTQENDPLHIICLKNFDEDDRQIVAPGRKNLHGTQRISSPLFVLCMSSPGRRYN